MTCMAPAASKAASQASSLPATAGMRHHSAFQTATAALENDNRLGLLPGRAGPPMKAAGFLICSAKTRIVVTFASSMMASR